MKQYLLLITVFIMLIGFFSCASENKTEHISKYAFSESKNIDITNSPKKITRNIIQDRNGNIWLATWEGMIKFDGKTFENITKNVSDNRFFSVLEDSNANFWFASIGGAFIFMMVKPSKILLQKRDLPVIE